MLTKPIDRGDQETYLGHANFGPIFILLFYFSLYLITVRRRATGQVGGSRTQ